MFAVNSLPMKGETAMYCPKCKKIVDGQKCPECKKQTREVKEEDICYLTEKQAPFAGMVKDVLEQNGIPCLLESVIGAGLRTLSGVYYNEIVKIYTNYSDLEKARQLLDEIYGAPVIEETDNEEESEEPQ